MKYTLLLVFLIPICAIAEQTEEVEEAKPAKIETLTPEQERNKLLDQVSELEAKIKKLEKDNQDLKNVLLRVQQQANKVRRLAVQSNSAATKVLDALERF